MEYECRQVDRDEGVHSYKRLFTTFETEHHVLDCRRVEGGEGDAKPIWRPVADGHLDYCRKSTKQGQGDSSVCIQATVLNL